MEITLPKGLEFPSYVEDLKEVLEQVQPRFTLIPEMRRHISRFVDGADMDEVYPHIYLGDCDAATNKQYLLRCGITHVLNAAANVKMGPAPVKTGEEYYKDTALVYLGLDLIDLPFANAAKHFEAAAEFIDSALKSGGTVLVHCRQGRSRSASVLAAFLMTRRGYTAARALTQLKQRRDIRPNNGFLTQLAELDLQLFRERLERIRLEPSSSSSSDSNNSRSSISPEKTSVNTHDNDTRRSSIESEVRSISLASTISNRSLAEREDVRQLEFTKEEEGVEEEILDVAGRNEDKRNDELEDDRGEIEAEEEKEEGVREIGREMMDERDRGVQDDVMSGQDQVVQEDVTGERDQGVQEDAVDERQKGVQKNMADKREREIQEEMVDESDREGQAETVDKIHEFEEKIEVEKNMENKIECKDETLRVDDMVDIKEEGKKEEDEEVRESTSKSSDSESVEYQSAVSSVCSSSTTSNKTLSKKNTHPDHHHHQHHYHEHSKYENARSQQSVSISVQLSLSRRKDQQCTLYVSRCVKVCSDDSLESDNDADDESSDNEA